MKLDRRALVTHLNRISCNGLLPGAVFHDAYGANALTEDQLLLVAAPELPETEKLEAPVGVADLSLLVSFLGGLAGSGNENVDVEVVEDDDGKTRLVIDEEERGTIRMMLAAPKTIGTKVEDHTVKALVEQVEEADGDGVPLTEARVTGIQTSFKLVKAEELEIFVGPDGGKVVVGNSNSHMANFDVPEFKTDEAYSLLFGRHFVDVLGTVSNYTDARLYLTGPDSLVLIEDEGYRYILSPKAKVAE